MKIVLIVKDKLSLVSNIETKLLSVQFSYILFLLFPQQLNGPLRPVNSFYIFNY